MFNILSILYDISKFLKFNSRNLFMSLFLCSTIAFHFSEKQDDNPIIEFNKETYEIGEVIKANCTTSVSRPPPHITWWINDEKVSLYIISFIELIQLL